MLTNYKRMLIILGVISVLLVIPFIAMQFSNEVNWSLFDFIVMGGLLLIVGLFLELILGTFRRPSVKIVLIVILFLLFLLTWAELAVGIFGTPFAGS
ncbi:hypothetical protein [Aestuariibaculum lutulentum]|uniref:Uncharacterized protein n=1 Tax=Aestuariibaculum lutulentum TaxID=2920935 RepID=A0ABS9REM9_9FLAO|nr:hypothetical protein [Aestuariibaculum lutulentum]MCH4551362.1 hypothetical protein [Aestuariibaculum lutulentum]